jgi:DNA adenine methylase
VPYGRYRRPAILDEVNILHVSELLQRTTLGIGRFDACRACVNDSSFVYFDPPYRPISTTANFTAYSANGFGEHDQIALSEFYADLDTTTDARLMLSNSDPTELDPDDDFFKIYYRGFRFHRVYASRMINADAGKRSKIPELVITNYA